MSVVLNRLSKEKAAALGGDWILWSTERRCLTGQIETFKIQSLCKSPLVLTYCVTNSAHQVCGQYEQSDEHKEALLLSQGFR